MLNNDEFIFSSNINGIFSCLDFKCELNDFWIISYLALSGPTHELDSNQTVFKDIMQLSPSSFVEVSEGSITEKIYWKPTSTEKLHEISDKDAEEGLLKVLTVAVEQRIKSNKNIGIFLSGGLDSSTVGAIASNKLANMNQNLYAYSSIPVETFKRNIGSHVISNESEYIMSLLDMYKNIIPNFHSSQDKNSITDIDQHLLILEHPYRFIENWFWIDELSKLALKDDCAIVVNGQYGNSTISFGDIEPYLIDTLKKFHLKDFYKNVSDYSKLMEVSKNTYLRFFLKHFFTFNDQLKSKFLFVNLENDNLANKQLFNSLGVKKKFKIIKVGSYINTKRNFEEIQKFNSTPRVFSQVNEAYCKLALEYGIEFRDPTMDKRVIEYCFSMPNSQFVREGKPRDLIRRTTRNILPDKIRVNYKYKGYQSADWIYRLEGHVEFVCNEVISHLKKDLFIRYVDCDMVEATLNSILQEGLTNRTTFEFRKLVLLLVFGRFLDSYDKS